jgi:hypothetical protein
MPIEVVTFTIFHTSLTFIHSFFLSDLFLWDSNSFFRIQFYYFKSNHETNYRTGQALSFIQHV